MELIPKQETGKQYDNIKSVKCADEFNAKHKYSEACNKLFNISDWCKTGDSILKTDFCLCDEEGKEVTRDPKIGDFIRINLSGPGSVTGKGFDWVKIEEVVTKGEENDYEFTSIKVRPAACPLRKVDLLLIF